MTTTQHSISLLRQRLIDDMIGAPSSPRPRLTTSEGQKKFTRFLGISPDEASAEDLRLYQLHMASSRVSRTTINAPPSMPTNAHVPTDG